MAAIDDIMGIPTQPKKLPTAPPPVDGSITPAPNQSQSGVAVPSATPQKSPMVATLRKSNGKQAPGIDATALVGKPGTAPALPNSGRSATASEPDATALVGNPGDTPGEKKRMSYVEMYKAMNPDAVETPEQKAKREKREKLEGIISAIGDGVSSFVNLYFATRYAPNSYDPSKGMSAKTKERWDKLKAEREAKRKEYYDGYLHAMQLDDANEKDDRNWRHTLDREQIADRYKERQMIIKEAEAQRDAEEDTLKAELLQGKIDAQQYQVAIAKSKAAFADKINQSIVDKNNRAGTGKGSGSGRGKGGSSGQPWEIRDKNGKVVRVVHSKSRDEAWSHVDKNKGEYITQAPSSTTKVEETTDSRGNLKNRKTTTTVKNSGQSGGSQKSGRSYTKTAQIDWNS